MAQTRTNIVVDSAKVSRAKRWTGLKTTKAVIDFALERLTQSAEALSSLVKLSGKIHFHRGYSYKRARG